MESSTKLILVCVSAAVIYAAFKPSTSEKPTEQSKPAVTQSAESSTVANVIADFGKKLTSSKPAQLDATGSQRGLYYQAVPINQELTKLAMSQTWPRMPKPVVSVVCQQLPIYEHVGRGAFKERWHVNGVTFDNPMLMSTYDYQRFQASSEKKRVRRPHSVIEHRLWVGLSDVNKEDDSFWYQTATPCGKLPVPSLNDAPAADPARYLVLTGMDGVPEQRTAFAHDKKVYPSGLYPVLPAELFSEVAKVYTPSAPPAAMTIAPANVQQSASAPIVPVQAPSEQKETVRTPATSKKEVDVNSTMGSN